MAIKFVGVGSATNDGTGDNIRVGGQKINNNFSEIYTRLDRDWETNLIAI